MTKAEEIAHPDSTWNRTADDEPVFILVARDIHAWESVLDWASRARDIEVPDEKVDGACDQAERMQQWLGLKKIPD